MLSSLTKATTPMRNVYAKKVDIDLEDYEVRIKTRREILMANSEVAIQDMFKQWPEQKKAFHYTNQQPLWAIDNLKKGAKYG